MDEMSFDTSCLRQVLFMLTTVGRSVFQARYTVHQEPYDKCEENLRRWGKQGRGVTSHSLAFKATMYMRT